MKISINNVYHYGNAGDTAIVLSTISMINERYKNAEIHIYTKYKDNIEFYEQITNVKVFLEPLIYSDNGSFIKKIYLLIKAIIDLIYSRYEIVYNVSFFCGGGALYSSRILTIGLYIKLMNFFFVSNKSSKRFILPHTIGPLNFIDTILVRQFISRVDNVFYRDSFSKKYQSNNFQYRPDVVFGFIKDYCVGKEKKENKNRKAGICIVDIRKFKKISKDSFNQYILNINTLIMFLKDNDWDVTLYYQVNIKINGDDDRKLNSYFDVENEVNFNGDIKEYLNKINNNDLFIGGRMHSCIFAMVQNVPCIGLSYQEKTNSLFSDLNLSKNVFSIYNFDPKLIIKRIEEIDKWKSVQSDQIIKIQKLSKGIINDF